MRNIIAKTLAVLTAFMVVMLGSSQAAAQEDEDGFTFGGAMRYNVIYTDYESGGGKTNPAFTWDTWRLNVDGTMKGVDLSFEYRFYPTFGTHFIHHGFLGYEFNDAVYMELGVTQVPFGIEDNASHSWWFSGAYYVGLEDDYDMGINFDITPADKLKISLAYFRQQEPEGPRYDGVVTFGNAGAGRFSYDVVPTGDAMVVGNDTVMASLRELNQFNARIAYDINNDWQIGASAQMGQLYNSVADVSDWTTAFAGHVLGNFGNFNLKAEYIMYDYSATSDAGNNLDVVQMGAYGFEYVGGDGYSGGVAAKANLYVAGLAYTIPVDLGPISSIQPYVDYTLIDKTNENFYDTHHLIPGFLVTAGSIYTYVDYAMGKNQPWLTDSFGKGLGTGVKDPEWNARLNINIGYYF